MCCKSLLMLLLLASEESVFGLPSPRQLYSPSSYPLDLSGLGDPPGSNTTAGLAIKSYWNSRALPPWQGGDTTGVDLREYLIVNYFVNRLAPEFYI